MADEPRKRERRQIIHQPRDAAKFARMGQRLGAAGSGTPVGPVRKGQLHIRWDSGSTLSMLPGEGDQVRLIARADSGDGTEPEDPLVARAGELGSDAGKAAATRVFGGNTPDVLCTLSSCANVEPYLGRYWRHSGCRTRRRSR